MRRSKKSINKKSEPTAPSQKLAVYSRRDELLVFAGLFLLIALVMGRSVFFGFINFDVMDYLTKNRMVQAGLRWEGIWWAFTTFKTGDWHPLIWLSFMLDCELFGINSFGSHLVNLLFHAANSMLLFVVLRKYTGDFWRPAFVAAFFAIHPLRVESVVWIAERKDVVSGLFWMLCMLSYHNYSRKPGPVRLSVLSILFLLGVMAKPILTVLPFALLLMDYWPLGRLGREKVSALLIEKIPLFLISAFSCFMTWYAVSVSKSVISSHALPFGFRVINAVISYLLYLQKTFWPYPLAYFYPHPMRSYSQPLFYLGMIVLVVITWGAIRQARKNPALATGWFWFLGTLVPTIGLVQAGDQAMADRYTYIPHIGLFMAIAWGFFKVKSGSALKLSKIFLVLGLLIMSALAWLQTGHWRDSVALNEHAVKVVKSNYLAHQNLALALAKKGEMERSAYHYKKSLEVAPFNQVALNNLANIFLQDGKIEEAESILLFSRRMNPKDVGTLVNLGVICVLQGRPEEGVLFYEEALRLDPGYVPAHKGLAAFYFDRKEMAKSRNHLEKILTRKPLDKEAHRMLGILCVRQNRFEDALKHFSAWLAQNLTDPDAHHWVGDTLFHLKRYDEAQHHYEQAIQLRSDAAPYYKSLGRLYRIRKEYDQALFYLKKSLAIDPSYAPTYSVMGKVFFQMGDVQTAIRHYQTALRLNPALPKAHKRMGDALAILGKKEDALKYYREALRLTGGKYPEVARILEEAGETAFKMTSETKADER